MADDGIEKGAALLLTLGEDHAAEVLRHLGPREVQKLGAAMAQINGFAKDKVEAILDEVLAKTADGSPLNADDAMIRSMLTKALGDERAANLIGRILQGGSDTAGIEGLKWMDAATVADLIKNEHPQIIATILVHLEADHAGSILKSFTERLRNDVILRIATLDGVQPVALRELNESLSRVMAGATNIKKTTLGGPRAAAEILNFVGAATETAVVDSVREYDPDLAQKIMDEMFVFENLLDIDDRGIQTLLREIQSESLILALKGASEEMRNKIFKNMSQRAAEGLKEDLEGRGPVRLSEVEAAQKEMLKEARRLSEEGQIQLGGKGDDAFV